MDRIPFAEKEPLMVEFTADQCPSCKFLEQTKADAPKTPARQSYNATGSASIKVDLTRPTRKRMLLRAIGSVSIGHVCHFPKGLLSNSPIVLSEICTTSQPRTPLPCLPLK